MTDKNIRNMTVTPSTGKDFRDTQVLDGVASKNKAANAKNETSQYETGKTDHGALGGKNTGN